MKTITRIRQYFENIEGQSSRNAKESLLKDYGHDELFVETLRFLYNPLITTGISEKKLKRMTVSPDHDTEKTEVDLGGLMSYLQNNSTGRDADLTVVADFMKGLDAADAAFANKLVSKNLKVGITAKTINKVFTGSDGEPFVYEFSPMLAADFAKRSGKIDGEFYVTQKIDGIRCLAFKDSNDNNDITVSLFARSGKEIIGQDHVRAEIADNEKIPVGTVIDGELLVKETAGLGVGEMFRSTQKIVRSESVADDDNIIFWVFDGLPVSEFKAGQSKNVYTVRRKSLETALAADSEDGSSGETDDIVLNDDTSSASTHGAVRLLPVLYVGDDKSMITLEAEKADNAGFEGVMVNSSEGKYQNKRVDALQKVKSFKTADLFCTSVVEGTGRHQGRLGAVTVEYRNNIVYVGSGFDDAERDLFFQKPDEIVGAVIEVKYFEETIDSVTGKPSLRFPVFVGVRDDKTPDDINYG